MPITKEMKDDVEKVFQNNPFNVNGIEISYKIKNGVKTSDLCVKFYVDEKKSKSKLKDKEIIPSEIQVGGKKFYTDVVEQEVAKSLACFLDSNDSNIQKLRGNPNLIVPLRGGQEIFRFPHDWTPAVPSGFTAVVGTLGFIAVDVIDDRIVGITNAHVACRRFLLATDRDLNEQAQNPYNTFEQSLWAPNNQPYNPGSLSIDVGSNQSFISGLRIKRYQTVSFEGPNYSDVALLIMNPSLIAESSSFKIHQPNSVSDNEDFLTFASTAEIDELLDNPKPRLFSTGRTTGPKGWGESDSCRLEAVALAVNSSVAFGDEETIAFNDLIRFEFRDGSDFPAAGGDSGSALVAEFGGVKKIVGLVFAGTQTQALACRIDRIANDIRIKQWDGTTVYDVSIPTASALSAPIGDPASEEKSIIQNGKEYLQVGITSETTYDEVD